MKVDYVKVGQIHSHEKAMLMMHSLGMFAAVPEGGLEAEGLYTVVGEQEMWTRSRIEGTETIVTVGTIVEVERKLTKKCACTRRS